MLELLKPGAPLRQFFAILPGESYFTPINCAIFKDMKKQIAHTCLSYLSTFGNFSQIFCNHYLDNMCTREQFGTFQFHANIVSD